MCLCMFPGLSVYEWPTVVAVAPLNSDSCECYGGWRAWLTYGNTVSSVMREPFAAFVKKIVRKSVQVISSYRPSNIESGHNENWNNTAAKLAGRESLCLWKT